MVEDGWVEWADIGREPAYSGRGGAPSRVVCHGPVGEVVVTGPVDDYIEELVAIAQALGANLIGEDGQRYTRGDVVD